MNKKSQAIATRFSEQLMHTYAPSVAIAEGHGCKVTDADGRKSLDFTAGIAVHALGHCHPAVVSAIQKQAAKLIHASNLFYSTPCIELAEKLNTLGLQGKTFFCNSGAEANEAMVKLARFWGQDKGKYEVITMEKSFHGRTLAMCAATGQSKVQKGFDPLPVGFAYAKFNDLASVEAQITDKTVAILIECVQGEGGVVPATREFVEGVRRLCDERGLLMLCDEVQCGMGRTGEWFGWQNYGVRPDAFSLAKALGGGLPMGALCANAELSALWQPGNHASTFGGNPVAAAAALAVIETIEREKILEQVKTSGEALKTALEAFVDKYDDCLAVRGLGLLVGLEVRGSAKEVVDAVRLMGLLCCAAGEHVVRFLPPLNVTSDELEEAMDMLSDSLDELYA